jgi:hypothetical protein
MPRPRVRVFDLPDEKIFGKRTVKEFKLPGGDLQLIQREVSANAKEFSLAFFGPKGGCKWEIQLSRLELTTIWDQMGFSLGLLTVKPKE